MTDNDDMIVMIDGGLGTVSGPCLVVSVVGCAPVGIAAWFMRKSAEIWLGWPKDRMQEPQVSSYLFLQCFVFSWFLDQQTTFIEEQIRS